MLALQYNGTIVTWGAISSGGCDSAYYRQPRDSSIYTCKPSYFDNRQDGNLRPSLILSNSDAFLIYVQNFGLIAFGDVDSGGCMNTKKDITLANKRCMPYLLTQDPLKPFDISIIRNNFAVITYTGHLHCWGNGQGCPNELKLIRFNRFLKSQNSWNLFGDQGQDHTIMKVFDDVFCACSVNNELYVWKNGHSGFRVLRGVC